MFINLPEDGPIDGIESSGKINETYDDKLHFKSWNLKWCSFIQNYGYNGSFTCESELNWSKNLSYMIQADSFVVDAAIFFLELSAGLPCF